MDAPLDSQSKGENFFGRKRIPKVPVQNLKQLSELKASPLTVNSWDELLKHEEEILRRIAHVINGGNLFITHPFQMLADIGVLLSDRTREEILAREPSLRGLSLLPYKALRDTPSEQHIKFRVHGLFRREK